MTDPTFEELYRIALTWTGGNAGRARLLVEARFRGAAQRGGAS